MENLDLSMLRKKTRDSQSLAALKEGRTTHQNETKPQMCQVHSMVTAVNHRLLANSPQNSLKIQSATTEFTNIRHKRYVIQKKKE